MLNGRKEGILYTITQFTSKAKNMIIASCGHTLKDDEDLGKLIAVKSYSREGKRAVDYPCVCDKCLQEYEKDNLRLTSREQEDAWLKNGK